MTMPNRHGAQAASRTNPKDPLSVLVKELLIDIDPNMLSYGDYYMVQTALLKLSELLISGDMDIEKLIDLRNRGIENHRHENL